MSWAFLFSSNMLIVGCDFKSSVTEVIWKSKQKIYHWHYFAEMQLNFGKCSKLYKARFKQQMSESLQMFQMNLKRC